MTSFVQPDLFVTGAARWPFGPLVPHAYGLIMIDPPWHMEMYSEAGEGRSPQAHYRTMSLEEIAALPVADLAAADCLLWLWGTTPLLPQQLQIMAAWGFRYSTNAVWAKRTRHGKRWFGTGYGGFRNEHEHILIGRIGSPRITDHGVRSIIEGEAREHSRKPETAYAAAERISKGVRRADVFSRRSRPGWEACGDEAGKFDGEDAPCERLPASADAVLASEAPKNAESEGARKEVVHGVA